MELKKKDWVVKSEIFKKYIYLIKKGSKKWTKSTKINLLTRNLGHEIGITP